MLPRAGTGLYTSAQGNILSSVFLLRRVDVSIVLAESRSFLYTPAVFLQVIMEELLTEPLKTQKE